MVANPISCGNPECRVAETGKCIEGVADLKACPHFGRPLTKAESSTEPAASPPPKGVVLNSGEYLRLTEGKNVLLTVPSRVVSVIGPSDAGKTSLIASVFELFHENRAGPIRFAGSRTLFALERACFHSRTTSAGLEPSHDHTPIGPANYYHVSVRRDGELSTLQMLLADRAGEEYTEAANRPVQADDFPELWQADTVTVLADGDRLTNEADRFDVIPNLRLMLERFIEQRRFSNRPQIACVLTKLDKVRDAGSDWPTTQLAAFKDEIMAQHGEHFGAVETFAVAASPHTNSAQRGEGVLDVLKFWMHPRPEIKVQMAIAAPSTRAFAILPADGGVL